MEEKAFNAGRVAEAMSRKELVAAPNNTLTIIASNRITGGDVEEMVLTPVGVAEEK